MSKTNPPPISIGPFHLLDVVGKGGMGDVWRAVHVREQIHVAIKVMTAHRAQSPRYQATFREEARAVARLAHPGIIKVFDCGTIPAGLGALHEGGLAAGSSFLAMELAVGSLAAISPATLDWPTQRVILLEILDALAHSHARGVIHRDLKPGNVLLVPDPGGVARYKLSDFGLAKALNDPALPLNMERTISGTPRFMAPEQITGQWRVHGPWTDLYALGCLAFWLASGAPPFRRGDTREILRSHLDEPIPVLEPRFPTPLGFEAWLHGLLAKSHLERYRCAADAIHDLLNLEPFAAPQQEAQQDAPFHTLAPDSAPESLFPCSLSPGSEELSKGPADTLAPYISDWHAEPRRSKTVSLVGSPPPIPESWRHATPAPRSIKLLGVGRGLFGLRTIPLVGREAERDAIWQALKDVHEDGRPRLMILRGMAGTGKTRLAEWIAERAHEVGAADILRATHGPISGPTDGLVRMFATHLHCVGLRQTQLHEHLSQVMGQGAPLNNDDTHDCLALTELLTSSDSRDEERIRIQFSNPRERYLVFRRLLARITRRRPALLVLDDVQWGSDTLGFVQNLLQHRSFGSLPVLLLVTVRDEALVDRRLAHDQLRHLVTLDGAAELQLGPLNASEHARLVQDLLGLQESLAKDVTRRTAGNPLFALQLVGDWVDRDVLHVGADGFRLAEGAHAGLPDDIHHLLRKRLELLVGQSTEEPPNNARLVLEVAAALGQDIELREWEYVCEQRGLTIPAGLVETMASNRLAHEKPTGWAFIHGALRESLERLAVEGGRWAGHHLACTQMLRGLYPVGTPRLAFRLSRHLLEANELADALEPMLEAANEFGFAFDIGHAHALFDTYEDTLSRLEVPETDRRWTQGWLTRAMTYIRQHEFHAAKLLLDRVEPIAKRQEWPDLLAEALYCRGVDAQLRGEVRSATTLAQASLDLFASIAHRDGQARASYLLGQTHYWAFQNDASIRFYTRARELFTELGDERSIGKCTLALGAIEGKFGDLERGSTMIHEAIKAFERFGDNYGKSQALSNLGDIYRYHDNLEGAQECYHLARELVGRADRTEVTIELNLCVTLLLLGRFSESEAILSKLEPYLVKDPKSVLAGIIYATWLPFLATTQDWQQWDTYFEQAVAILTESDLSESDLAQTIHIGADLVFDAGQTARARAVYEFALGQWRRLDDEDKIQEITDRLAGL